MFLLDLRETEFTGKTLENKLETYNIITNKNTIPNDQRSPFETSGLRIGTPAITTRGFQESHARDVAQMISDVILRKEDPNIIIEQVKVLTQQNAID